MEVIEWHVVSVASEHEETVADDHPRVPIASWRSLARSLGSILVVLVARVHPILLLVHGSLLDLVEGLLEAGVCILNEEGVLHRDGSWRLQLDFPLVFLHRA